MSAEMKKRISLHKKGRMLGANNPSWKGGMIAVDCSTCNVSIKKYPAWVKNKNFCSKGCESSYKKSDPNHAIWNKGLVRSEDHKKKMSLAKLGKMTGESHPRWIKDRTKLAKRQERNDTAYKEWRKNVWLRDNWKCKIANPDCKGRIEAHHILGWTAHPELRYEVNNGITLCHAHHPRKRSEEAKLSPYFQSLVAEKQ